MEHLYGLHLLSGAHEFYRFVDHRADRQGSTATGIPIELGKNHPVVVQSLVELPGCIHGILTGHGVDHQQDLIRPDLVLNGGNLLHHQFVNGQTARGIDDHHIKTILPGMTHGIPGNHHGFQVPLLGVHGHVDLTPHDLELFNGGRPVNVTGDQQGMTPPLVLEHIGQLSRKGGLTRPL